MSTSSFNTSVSNLFSAQITTGSLTVTGNSVSFLANSIAPNAIIGGTGGAGGVSIISSTADPAAYIPFTSTRSGNVTTTLNTGNLVYNANTNTLTASLAGTAAYAGTAANVALTQDGTSGTTNYVSFTGNSTGSCPVKTSSKLTLVPSSGVLTCGGLTTAGNLTAGNLTVTGLTSFPANSIPSNAIVGGGGVSTNSDFSTLSNDIDYAGYQAIPFMSCSRGYPCLNPNLHMAAEFLYNANMQTLSLTNVLASTVSVINGGTLSIDGVLTVNTNAIVDFSKASRMSFPANSIASNAIIGGTGVSLVSNNTVTSAYVPFTSASTGAVTSLNTDSGLMYNASTDTLTSNLNGTAAYATNVGLISDTASATANYLSFTANSTGTGPVKTNSMVTLIPSTGVLTCGGLTTAAGNVTAANLIVTGQVSLPANSIASNAIIGGTGVSLALNTTDTLDYIPFASAISGANVTSLNTSNGLTYSAATNTLTCATLNGTAVFANKVNMIQDNTSTTTNFLTINAGSGGQLKTNAYLTFIPSTGVLTCGGLMASSGNVTAGNLTAGNVTVTGVISCGGLNTSGNSGYTAYASSNAAGTYGTATGQIGNIVSGAIYLTPVGSATIIISVITLSAGVWLITGAIQGSNSTTTQYKAGLSITAGSGVAGGSGTINNNNQSSIITPVSTANTVVALNCSTVVCITSSTQYNLVLSMQTLTFTITTGQYTAVRIA